MIAFGIKRRERKKSWRKSHTIYCCVRSFGMITFFSVHECAYLFRTKKQKLNKCGECRQSGKNWIKSGIHVVRFIISGFNWIDRYYFQAHKTSINCTHFNDFKFMARQIEPFILSAKCSLKLCYITHVHTRMVQIVCANNSNFLCKM